jgi:hypothetical protein
MSSESIIYGFIESATWRQEEYRRYQSRNLHLLSELPEKDKYPFLSKGMFSAPGFEPGQGTHRVHVIHFGASMKNFEFEEVPLWVEKFEQLLSKLYWFRATAHIITEMDLTYRFDWSIHPEVIATYHAGDPSPSRRWERKDYHGTE